MQRSETPLLLACRWRLTPLPSRAWPRAHIPPCCNSTQLAAGWNCTTSPPMAPGATICSATQTVVPWSVLPAQVIYCEEAAADFGSAGGQGESWDGCSG